MESDVCGCCGGTGCTYKLVRRGKVFQPDVTCAAGYFSEDVRWSQAPWAKDGAKCTNTPLECPSCAKYIWKYSMAAHWKRKHGREVAPTGLWELQTKGLAFMEKIAKQLKPSR
eukprot:gene5549-biopygen2614